MTGDGTEALHSRVPSEPESDVPLEWALYYAALGFKVFPLFEVIKISDGSLRCCCHKGVACENAGKHPRTAQGFHDARLDERQIRQWWEQWRNANVAIRTGDGYAVLDVDVIKGGDESIEALEMKYGPLPKTRQALTGSRGRHHWFRLPEGVQLGCFNGFEDGLDIRADGGYVVVEPSVHKTGNIYRWDGFAGFSELVAEMPRWLLNMLLGRQSGAGEPWRQLKIRVNRHPELPPALLEVIEHDIILSGLWNLRRVDFANPNTGEPNFSAYDMALASHFVKAGFAPQQVAEILTAFRLKHGNPKDKGYRLDYLQRTIHKAMQNENDQQPGSRERRFNSDVPGSLEPLVVKIEATGDITLVYQHIDDFAALPEAELAVVYQRFKAALKAKLNRTHFDKAIKEARERLRQRSGASTGATEPRQPYVERNGCIIRVKDGKGNSEEIIPLTNFMARITSDIGEDDGVEIKRFFGIDAALVTKSYSFIIPANRFAIMEWPIENIGPNAIVQPNQKDWARAAIQSLSTNVQSRQIYVHTGWRRVGDSMLYLHGAGAIGADGAAAGIDVRLSGALVHYLLILPENHDRLVEAVRTSLQVLNIAPDQIVCPLLAAVYRACVKSCDFAVWLGGPTGVFKSELAAQAQQHYGAAMNARRLPGNFASTGNALEALAFGTKDALLVIDDFAPQGSMQDVARYHAAADRILRAAGNNQGRGRLSSDARLREAKPPRGLVLATGEDMPRGQSIRGRTLIVEVAPGDVQIDILSECQVSAAEGAYVRAMGGFVQWLAGRYEQMQAGFQQRVFELRSRATRAHSRTPGIVADLFAGFELFLEFAVASAAITTDEQQELGERCWKALNAVAKAQRVQQDVSEPTHRFMELLRAVILSGEAHVDRLNGGAPGEDGEWGWYLSGSGDHQRFLSRGNCVGWLDGNSLYLEPTASFGVVQDLGRVTGEPLAVSEATLKKRLKEKGLLVSTDIPRGTLTVRRVICGKSIPVLHLRRDVLESRTGSKTPAEAETVALEC